MKSLPTLSPLSSQAPAPTLPFSPSKVVSTNPLEIVLDIQQFSQMLRGLQGERIRQAFQLFEKHGSSLRGHTWRTVLASLLSSSQKWCRTRLSSSSPAVAASAEASAAAPSINTVVPNVAVVNAPASPSATQNSAPAAAPSITTPESSGFVSPVSARPNLLQIAKIRLQTFGLEDFAKVLDPTWRNRHVAEARLLFVEGAPMRSAMWSVRNLGLVGLYKGASALRRHTLLNIKRNMLLLQHHTHQHFKNSSVPEDIPLPASSPTLGGTSYATSYPKGASACLLRDVPFGQSATNLVFPEDKMIDIMLAVVAAWLPVFSP
ncbi:hypothetical protein QBC45DRAFT_485523 [Copromyces sp. CBS 386.78]|nr:hypothetical protein QBC45DRAFT_485523 [Copromyces sp. CBS 386.78]